MNLQFLLQLRWVAILGELITILVALSLLKFALPFPQLFAILSVELLLNLILWFTRRSIASSDPTHFSILLLNVLFLTALLYLTGGPSNPFSALYLLQISLASFLLSAMCAWILTFITLCCFALLFPFHVPLPGLEHHGSAMNIHLWGMWVALGLTGIAIVSFIWKMRKELRVHEEKLRNVQTVQALASMSALAAHELSTPLSTIAVVAKELEHQLKDLDIETKEDVRLIREEISRCKTILGEISRRSGRNEGEELSRISLSELLEEVRSRTGSKDRVILQIQNDVTLRLPKAAIIRAVQNIVANALEASSDPVRVSTFSQPPFQCIEIRDLGKGLSPEQVTQIGTPYYSLKPDGQGMGLGAFLAKTTVEQLGGLVQWDSQKNKGTRALIKLPTES